MRIVLVTPGQPSLNPRIVKEANALSAAGHEVIVLYCYWIAWADEADKIILNDSAWKAILVGGCPTKNRLPYYFTKVFFRLYKFLGKYDVLQNSLAERLQARGYNSLLRKAKSLKANYYIGHNLGALAVVVNAAKQNNAKCGFDFEDYHRNEYSLDNHRRTARIIFLEEKYIRKVDYLSFSSEPIQNQILLNFPDFKKPCLLLQNCFSLSKLAPSIKPSDIDLKLLWFSQTIGPNRGLECLFEALMLLNDKDISLTLIGRVKEDVEASYTMMAGKIVGEVRFVGTVNPDELHTIANNHDVGLALEPGFSINNNLALSNKIFTYLLAGNAIIFSETTAQNKFNVETNAGCSFTPGNAEQLVECIKMYKDPTKLIQQKKHNLLLAKNSFNWEKESEQLIEIISQ